MFSAPEILDEEPPLSRADAATRLQSLSDVMLGAAPPRPGTHALVIARHTLAPTLTLMKSGCDAVECHALGTPNAHLDAASLAWIADVETAPELESAVHQASASLTPQGAMVVDATALYRVAAGAAILQYLAAVGFRLKSVLRNGSRVILIATRRPTLVAV
jgi:hypothetical protein